MSKIVVLGGGESGCGAAILAQIKGFEVFLSDRGAIAPKYKALLEEWRVSYEEGHHTEELIFTADEVVKSPGIPEKAPLIHALRERKIPILSEIEFAGRFLEDSHTICITGSNGKTTTTTLTYQMLKDADMNVALSGNIGQSLALAVATDYYDWYVIELSSFQLDGMYDFRADIGVLMNITPDHLDRYNYQLQNYVDSKFRILQNQTPRERFIYCADDPITLENLPAHSLPMQTLTFTAKNAPESAASFDGEFLRVKLGTTSFQLAAKEMKIQGIHNMYDAMAASLAALSAGVPVESICETLRNFGGVEHRLEPCGKYNGVTYINDSKATNVDSVWYALDSMTQPVVWIAGGTDKGNDYAQLSALAKAKVKTLVCMGVDNSKLIRDFSGLVGEVIDTHSLDEAMQAASTHAAPGDAVLLSPACASFDLFKNYEQRGELFKKWILDNLKK